MIKVGSTVAWTAEHLKELEADKNHRDLLSQRRSDTTGTVCKIHEWSDAPPSVSIVFNGRLDVAYLDEVQIASN